MEEQTFSAQIDAWTRKSKARMEAVAKTATQELFIEVLRPMKQGGRMRVVTGFLRASFQASLDAPVNLSVANPDPENGEFSTDLGAILLVIDGADLGQTIYGAFTANYARPREYGARGQAPDAFVLTNAQRWPEFVQEAITQVRSEVES